MRSRARAGGSPSAICRSRNATTSSWLAAASAGSRPPGSIAARPAGAHPDPRQPRRLRRPCQAQRVHGRWTRRIIGYGGSQSFQSPEFVLRPSGQGLAAANSASTSSGSRPRSNATSILRSACRAACSFARETFGRDVLVAGDAPRHGRRRAHARPRQRQAAGRLRGRTFRSRRRARRSSSRSIRRSAIRSPAAAARRSARILKRTSYRDYLTKFCGCSDEVADLFQGRTLGFFGLGADAVPAEDVRDLGYPGFAGLGLRAGKRRPGASPTSITSPTAMPRSPDCWCAR